MHLKNETFYVLIFLKKKSSSEERQRQRDPHSQEMVFKYYAN